MVWLAKWIRENITDARVLLLTDRTELDEQIEKVFFGVDEKIHRTKSSKELLAELNTKDKWLLCSLVHKFGRAGGTGNLDVDDYVAEIKKNLPKDFSAKGNLFVFVDECHRTQSGKLHEAMKELLPKGATSLMEECGLELSRIEITKGVFCAPAISMARLGQNPPEEAHDHHKQFLLAAWPNVYRGVEKGYKKLISDTLLLERAVQHAVNAFAGMRITKILAAEGVNAGDPVICMHANASDLALERRVRMGLDGDLGFLARLYHVH